MIFPARHPIISSCLLWMAVILFVWVFPHSGMSGISVTPVPQDAAAAQQRQVSIFYEAQKSQQEKLRVGQVRYKMMLTNRANIIAGMNAELAARQLAVNIPSTPVSASKASGEKSQLQTWTVTLIGVIFIGLALISFRYFLSRQEAKNTIVSRKF